MGAKKVLIGAGVKAVPRDVVRDWRSVVMSVVCLVVVSVLPMAVAMVSSWAELMVGSTGSMSELRWVPSSAAQRVGRWDEPTDKDWGSLLEYRMADQLAKSWACLSGGAMAVLWVALMVVSSVATMAGQSVGPMAVGMAVCWGLS